MTCPPLSLLVDIDRHSFRETTAASLSGGPYFSQCCRSIAMVIYWARQQRGAIHDRGAQLVHPQRCRSAVAAISGSFWRRAVEAAGHAGNGRLATHRLSDFDVPADGLRQGAPAQ